MWSSLSYNHWDYWQLYHKITADYDRKLIFVNPNVTELDVKIDLYSDLKELWKLDSLEYKYNRFRPPVRVIGGDATIEGQTAGDIYFMQNGWRVVYDPTETRINGVLFSDDYDTPWLYSETLTPVYPAQVASLVTASKPSLDGLGIPTQEDLNIINSTAFGGVVVIDTLFGVNGTLEDVIGTYENPSKNLDDALTIAENYKIKKLVIKDTLTIVSGKDVSGYTIIGDNKLNSQLTLSSGCITTNTQFEHISISNSTFGGSVEINNCILDNVSGIKGTIANSVMNNSITLAGTVKTLITDCKTNVPVNIDFNDLEQHLEIRNLSGDITILNSSDVNSVSNINAISGSNITLDTTHSNGATTVSGICNITDNSTGGTVDVSEALSQSQMVDGLWKYVIENGYTVEEVIKLMAAVIQGNATGLESGTMTFKGLDGTTERVKATYVTGDRSINTRDAS